MNTEISKKSTGDSDLFFQTKVIKKNTDNLMISKPSLQFIDTSEPKAASINENMTSEMSKEVGWLMYV